MNTQPILLMTDPAHYRVAYRINPWMQPAAWSADPLSHERLAKRAWRSLKAALEDSGAEIRVIPATPGLPDMVFPANAAVVLDRKALVARFRHRERAGESGEFLAAFEALRAGGQVDEVTPITGCFQEGAGDCIWDATRRLFWVGSGPRSSSRSAGIIADHFGAEVVSLPLASERYYHLDTCFCPLSGGEVLYYPPALTDQAIAALRARVPPHQLIEAEAEDAEAFCVNAVSLGRNLVMAAPSERLRERLDERGYKVVGVDLAPFILSGGGAFCMTLRLDLSTAPATAEARQPALAAV
ncbi:MAG: dimethylarginine dimethylaminohydrolase family protein [Caulobacteraceae bacterium]